MQSIPTNCPRCEALESFRPQRRPVGDKRIEVFIRCTTCNYEVVLRVSTVQIELLRKQLSRWQSYGRATRAKHGVPSSLATAQVAKINRCIQELENEIA